MARTNATKSLFYTRPSSDKVHRKHHKLSLQSNSLQLSLACLQIKEQILGYDTTDTTPTGECAKMHLFVKNEPAFQSKHHHKYNTYLVKHKKKRSQTLSQHVNRIVTQAWRTCIQSKGESPGRKTGVMLQHLFMCSPVVLSKTNLAKTCAPLKVCYSYLRSLKASHSQNMLAYACHTNNPTYWCNYSTVLCN